MYKRMCCFALVVLFSMVSVPVFARTSEQKITVMNPVGMKPPIRQIPMAERQADLEGKTIYIVDTKFPRTREFVKVLAETLTDAYPKTRWVLRDKFGGYMDDDPELWAEIKEKGSGAIVAVGH